MSKSAREDRPWGYKGHFTLSPISTEDELALACARIVDGCTCYGCEANRRWLKQINEMKDNKA